MFDVTLAEAITRCLIREGVDRVFGVPGGYFTVLFDAFSRAGLPSVEGRHEGAAACMAAGYAQASGQVGVVYTQCGPGATNALTGFAAAYMDSIPMLLLASQSPREDHGRDGHQESTGLTRGPDQLDIFRTVSHFNARPMTSPSAVRQLRLALSAARGNRGPAALELSQDLLPERVEFDDLPPQAYRAVSGPVDLRAIDQLLALLAEAKRPALLVGDRAVHLGTAPELLAFCEAHEIACATVDWAKGAIPEDHPLSLGVLGIHGHASATDYFRGADLVVLLGVRMSHATTIRFQADLFKNAVQFDVDPVEIGRSMPVRLGAVGDLGATIRALAAASKKSPRVARQTRAAVAELRQRHKVYAAPEPFPDDVQVTPTQLLHVLRQELPREAIVVSDTGFTAICVKQSFPVYATEGFFSLYGLAAMGSSLPISHGIQLARPDAVVLDIIGDGGFLVHPSELSVAAAHRLPVIHVVVKNGLYKSVADRQLHFYGGYYATEIPSSNYARVAEGFGCRGYAARTAREVKSAFKEALAARQPAVIEVEVANESMFDRLPLEMRQYNDRVFVKQSKDWPFPKD